MSMYSYKDLLTRFGATNTLPSNPFYILGLPSDATPRQIRRRKEDLEAAHELGGKEWNASFPYLLKGSSIPSYEEVQEAFFQIEDISVRIISAFFWFWMPVHDHEGKVRHAYERLLTGDIAGAEEEWRLLSETPRFDGHGICGTALFRAPKEAVEAYFDRHNQHVYARHNLGVLNRVKAMIQDNALLDSDGNISTEEYESLKSTWASALSYERQSDPNPHNLSATSSQEEVPRSSTQGACKIRLTSYDDAEDVFISRWAVFLMQDFIKTDPRITDDLLATIKSVVRDLPVAWQAIYVIEYAKKDDDENVKRHSDFLALHIGMKYLSEDVLKCLFGDMINRHMTLIRHFDEMVKTRPEEGLNASNSLFDATSKDYDAIHALLHGDALESNLQTAKSKRDQGKINLLEMHRRIHESVYDPVVKAYLRYMIKFSEATKDWKIAIAWDKFLLKIAVSEKLRVQIEHDFLNVAKAEMSELVVQYRDEVKLDPMMGIGATKGLLSWVQKLVDGVKGGQNGFNENVQEISNLAVRICRQFLIAYGNATNDWSTCISEARNLISNARSKELILLVENDIRTLQRNMRAENDLKHAAEALSDIKRKSNESSPLVNVVWCIVLAGSLLGVVQEYKSSSRQESLEMRYIPTQASVTSCEEWMRVKTKGGVGKSREPYFKTYYEYSIGNQIYTGVAVTNKVLGREITVYYDPQNPSYSTTKFTNSKDKFTNSEDSLIALCVVLSLAILFIPINIILFCVKIRKRFGRPL